jgi:hypothetical protein
MRLLARKSPREFLVKSLFFLQKEQRIRVNRWLRGRHEYRKLLGAGCVIVSSPKSGRTWLRTMLTRFYQIRFEIDKMELVGFYNFHKYHPAIPRILFTHDNYIKDYTGNSDNKSDFYDKKVVFLVRDPRDVVVSDYFHWKYRSNPLKDDLRDIQVGPDGPPLFEFAMFRLPRIIDFLNAWCREIPNLPNILVVRYEDLMAKPADCLERILEFLGTPGEREEIDEAVRFAQFDNMKSLEARAAFGSNDRRITPGDPNNPQSFKVRRAKVGGYRDYFTDEEAAAIDDLVATRLAPEFGYEAVSAGLE